MSKPHDRDNDQHAFVEYSQRKPPCERALEISDGAPQNFEREKWDNYFNLDKESPTTRDLYSKRNLIFDTDAAAILREYFPEDSSISIAEAGCGSGIASYELSMRLPVSSITLIDVSKGALKFSELHEPKHLSGLVKRVLADIVSVPMEDDSVDLCWNIGVIEHYNWILIEKIAREMSRITRRGGVIFIAIPNRNNVATVKAAILGSKFGRRWLSIVPGYRFDSEILYGNNEMSSRLENIIGSVCHIAYAGSCLWYGAPDSLVTLADRILNRSPFSFLSCFVLRKP